MPHELVPHGALPPSVGTDTKLVIVSHDCDIVNPSYEFEPFIEVLIARPQAEKNGALLKGKNPRRLQFIAEESGKSRVYEIDVHEKYRVARDILEKGSRDAVTKIEANDVRVIAKWVARRYTRPSFPSAFVDRVGATVKKKILKKLEKDGDDVLYILVAFETLEEISSDSPYRIVLRVVVPQEACEADEREQRALGVVSEIRKLLGQCSGITVEDADLASSAEMTLYEYEHFIRWDVDYLSPSEEDITK